MDRTMTMVEDTLATKTIPQRVIRQRSLQRTEGRCDTALRPGELGLVSIEDDDEVRQIQFEAASRLAAWVS